MSIPTTLGDATYYFPGHRHHQFAAGNVVQEGNRFGSRFQHIVGTHGKEIVAQLLVHALGQRQLYLGADSIGGLTDHRILVVQLQWE